MFRELCIFLFPIPCDMFNMVVGGGDQNLFLHMKIFEINHEGKMMIAIMLIAVENQRPI